MLYRGCSLCWTWLHPSCSFCMFLAVQQTSHLPHTSVKLLVIDCFLWIALLCCDPVGLQHWGFYWWKIRLHTIITADQLWSIRHKPVQAKSACTVYWSKARVSIIHHLGWLIQTRIQMTFLVFFIMTLHKVLGCYTTWASPPLEQTIECSQAWNEQEEISNKILRWHLHLYCSVISLEWTFYMNHFISL